MSEEAGRAVVGRCAGVLLEVLEWECRGAAAAGQLPMMKGSLMHRHAWLSECPQPPPAEHLVVQLDVAAFSVLPHRGGIFDDNVYCHVTSGLGAGLFAVICGSPVDVVKSRMMGGWVGMCGRAGSKRVLVAWAALRGLPAQLEEPGFVHPCVHVRVCWQAARVDARMAVWMRADESGKRGGWERATAGTGMHSASGAAGCTPASPQRAPCIAHPAACSFAPGHAPAREPAAFSARHSKPPGAPPFGSLRLAGWRGAWQPAPGTRHTHPLLASAAPSAPPWQAASPLGRARAQQSATAPPCLALSPSLLLPLTSPSWSLCLPAPPNRRPRRHLLWRARRVCQGARRMHLWLDSGACICGLST